jgi:hypothetical protein
VQDGVHRAIQKERLADVVHQRLKAGTALKVRDVIAYSSNEVVDGGHLPAFS